MSAQDNVIVRKASNAQASRSRQRRGGGGMREPVRYHLGRFPPDNIEWPRLVTLIGTAREALGRYDGLVSAIPNAAVLLSPLTTQEAVLSSKIEGTNVTMSEVLEIEAGADGAQISQAKREDAEEIRNYRMALWTAAGTLDERPLSLHLLRGAHSLLMDGVRGRDKSPGAFRDEQNWIGPAGCTIEQANFVPIPQEHLAAGLDQWAAYVGSTVEPDPLVQLAIIHLEFEALHPFKDGNGRLGRMIIPLFLYARKLLHGPNFYMSGYLEARREEYVERMRAVSCGGMWTNWCIFFLNGLIEQVLENQARARAILKLHQRLTLEVPRLLHSKFASSVVDFIFATPVFASALLVERSGIPQASVLRFLALLRDAGTLRMMRERSGRRPAIYAFPELLNIAEGRTLI
jgi:Fic family protein